MKKTAINDNAALIFPRRVMSIPVVLFLVSSLQLHRTVVVFDHIPHECHASHTGKRDAACLIRGNLVIVQIIVLIVIRLLWNAAFIPLALVIGSSGHIQVYLD